MATDETPTEGERVFVFNTDTIPGRQLSQETLDRIHELIGDDKPCGTVHCPASYAGYSPGSGDATLTAANCYDRIVSRRTREGEYERLDGDDVLAESDVKEAWLDAVRHLAYVQEGDRDRESRQPFAVPHPDGANYVDAGHEVAYDLGWLDEDERVEAEASGAI